MNTIAFIFDEFEIWPDLTINFGATRSWVPDKTLWTRKRRYWPDLKLLTRINLSKIAGPDPGEYLGHELGTDVPLGLLIPTL